MSDARDEIRRACEQVQGYDAGTAYQRAKVACSVLVERGEPVPNWMVLREIIGKGSSTDINRGIRDFRRDHAERLRQMSGVLPGVPEQLAPMVADLWDAAVAEARRQFDATVAQMQSLVDQADARAAQAAEDVLAACAQLDAERAALQVANERCAGLELQLASERGRREQAEALFESHRAELISQRDQLGQALEENRREMQRALDRLDGERRHALMRVEEVRAAGAKELERERNLLNRKIAGQADDLVRLNQTVVTLRGIADGAEQRSAALAEEAAGLRERLKQSEALCSQLREAGRTVGAISRKVTMRHTSAHNVVRQSIGRKTKKP